MANLRYIFLVGSMGAKHDTLIMAEIAAVNLALQFCKDRDWKPSRIFCDCSGIPNLLKNFNACIAWHLSTEFTKLKQNLNFFPNLHVELISREDNDVADALANFGRHNVQLALFFQGLNRPCWLEDIRRRKNISF